MELYIPKTVTVGFQKREGTFTGKLAYIVYTDNKGVLRKEGSWNSWRDEKIDPITIDNVPMDEFTFNRGIQRNGYNWGSGRSVIRVHDSRDFEFEITVDNLIGILMHTDVSKRSITEKCVYAWHGKDLVLLPVNSEDYEKSVKFTNKIESKFSAKELVIGRTYSAKRDNGEFIYLGRLDRWENTSKNYYYRNYEHVGKKHVFMTEDGKVGVFEPSSKIAGCINEEIHPNFADIYQKYLTTTGSQDMSVVEFVKLELSDVNRVYDNYTKIHAPVFDMENNKYLSLSIFENAYHNDDGLTNFCAQSRFNTVHNNTIRIENDSRFQYNGTAKSISRDESKFAKFMGVEDFSPALNKPLLDVTEEDLETLFKSKIGKLVRKFKDGKVTNLGD